ncbi:MAG: hypothetical protein K2X80_05920 [Pseudomonadaceae bacterium]|nr:hypothetical protein [Pseudomonadaceae bacterium]
MPGWQGFYLAQKKPAEAGFFILALQGQSRRLRSFSDTGAVKERPRRAKKPKSFIFSPLVGWWSLDDSGDRDVTDQQR